MIRPDLAEFADAEEFSVAALYWRAMAENWRRDGLDGPRRKAQATARSYEAKVRAIADVAIAEARRIHPAREPRSRYSLSRRAAAKASGWSERVLR